MADPVRIALLGNSFARRACLPALRWAARNQAPNEVVGVAGADAAKARETAEEWGIPRATGDWRELLDPAPDLVVVSTPVDLHAPMARAALEAGCAVLCEKPFTLDAGEAEELVRLASGRAAWIDHELRWNPWRRALRSEVRKGAIGEVWLAETRMHIGGPRHAARPFGWWFQEERGGGILGALGSHMIDALRWDLGEVAAVRAHLEVCRTTRPDEGGAPHEVTADEHASLTLRLASGALAELSTSIVRRSEYESWVEYEGSEGALRLENDEVLRRRDGEGAWTPFDALQPLPTAEELGMPFSGAFARSLPLFLRDVVRAVGRGDPELPAAATFEDGLAVQRVLDAARRSHAGGGGWVEVPGGAREA